MYCERGDQINVICISLDTSVTISAAAFYEGIYHNCNSRSLRGISPKKGSSTVCANNEGSAKLPGGVGTHSLLVARRDL